MEKEREQQLIRDAINDPSAFSELFEEHYNSILRYCMYHTGQAESARDIAADTFFKALKNIKRYKITAAPFSAWLYRIAGNEITDHFRKNKLRKNLLAREMCKENMVSLEFRDSCQQEVHEIQQLLQENHAYKNIYIMINSMPMVYREVLILRYVENKKNSEICEIINKKEGTVKSLLSRGVALLRTNYRKKGLPVTMQEF